MGAAQQCGFHTAVVIEIMRSLVFAALLSSPMTNLLCGPCRQTTLLTDKLTFSCGDASHKHPDINQLKRTDVNKCSKTNATLIVVAVGYQRSAIMIFSAQEKSEENYF
jgi:hypothetical protein